LKDQGKTKSTQYIAKTIVTTDMLDALAKHYGVKSYGNMLVGFKYIGELIRNKESTDEEFIIGGEESFGLLKGTYARDKDGATGALPLAEYAAELKAEGKTLYDRLLELYAKHGLYVERLDTVVCPGADGFEKMSAIMASLRTNPPQTIGDYEVTATIDYSELTRTDIVSGATSDVDCARGNVFVLEFGDTRRRITIRPSGTEPKIKFYIQWFDDVDSRVGMEVAQQYEVIAKELEELSHNLEKQLIG
ncbi:phospho-sugar mutase, partial [Candidatus Saccharibacteria bacterium]|nr:phospho-sugar mutase [Candidatus Saccharibacteria bacterium]